MNILLIRLFLVALFLLPTSFSFAQSTELYVPLEIQRAYQQGTRSVQGTPGPNYWQNRSDYQIKATFEPETRQLSGEETVTYTNNSPDTLRQLVIRLYPDIFKKGAARDEAVAPVDITDGVDIEQLTVNGKTLDLKGNNAPVRRTGTNMFVSLPTPLFPANKVKLTVNWSYTIPKETHIREGSYGKSSFFVAYWYPQIAVYDDISGWDIIDYTGTQEFYNDFGNFDVELTVPGGYAVWATGVLQNPDDVLAKEVAGRYQQARTSDEIVRIVTKEDVRKGRITAGKSSQTWRFQAEYVPDFAFATSNEYLWDATSVVVDPKTNRRTVVGAAYNPDSKDFYEVARFGRQSVEYFSKELPGIPFPYPSLTVFNGSGGMEFPMMVNDGSYGLKEAAEVTAHEIAHSYFPFYMGINERKYAWMDEGWAQVLPNEIPFKLKPADNQTFNVQSYNARYLSSFIGKELEMPMMTPSVLLNGLSYGFASYFRPGVAYALLKNMLGDEKFKRTLQEYMRRWNGKHPVPYDFFYSFNEASGQNLNWYWKPWFFEPGYPDLAVKNISATESPAKITVENKGTLPVPVYLRITYADGTSEVVQQSVGVWEDGQKEIVLDVPDGKAILRVELGNLQIPDVDLSNNTFQLK